MSRTKVCVVADVHLANHRKFGGSVRAGVNHRATMILEALDTALSDAVADECAAFVVAGDLFDHVRPEPQLLAAVAELFAPRREEDLEVFLLVGNHDIVSAAAGDHALGPLRALEHVSIIEQPHVARVGRKKDLELLLVPYRSGPTSAWLGEALARLALAADERVAAKQWADPKGRVLCLHAGVRDAQTAPWLKDAADAIDADTLGLHMLEHDVGVAVAGNWHDHRSWEFTRTAPPNNPIRIVQAGALVPTGFDNPGLDGYGSVIVTDGLDWSLHEAAGPRFVIVSDEAEYRAAAKCVPPGTLFVRWKAPTVQLGAAAATLAEDELALGLAGVEAVVDADDRAARASAAAEAARAASGSLDGAVRAYVGAMALEDGVDRDAVAARALRYLG